jgi:hypothetical protein
MTWEKVLNHEQHAAECRQMAAQMKNPRYKKQLQDMAEVWDRLAHERRQGIVENENQFTQMFSPVTQAASPR